MNDIQEILRKLSGFESEQIYSLVCKVISLDKLSRSCVCEPLNGDSTIHDVKLQADNNQSTGVVVFPTIGSFVIVTFLSKEIAYIALSVEVDEIEIDATKIIINKGVNGGVPIASNIAARLNALEQRMASHQHLYIPITGPPAIPTLPDLTSNPIIPLTAAAMLENDNIKHG